MTGHIMIIDPKTDGAEIRKAELTREREWLQIAMDDLIIKVHLEDIDAVTGDEGHG